MAKETILTRAMREVHKNKPSTATKKGGEAQLRAIAYSKARKAGYKGK